MPETTETAQPDFITLTADLVSAYVSNNHVAPSDLPALIGNVHAALAGMSVPAAEAGGPFKKLTPAEIKKSLMHDHIISFEDGKALNKWVAKAGSQI